MSEKYYSDFLFARDGFLTGVASILDFASTLSEFNYSRTPEEADEIALRADWQAVGDSLRGAMRNLNADAAQR